MPAAVEHWVLRTSPSGEPLLAWGARGAGLDAVKLGFPVVVIMAQEWVGDAAKLGRRGIRTVPVGIDDDDALPNQKRFREMIATTANEIARVVRHGLPVLVTCNLGMNRSALMAAAIEYVLTGHSGKAIRRKIQRRRPSALRNVGFARWVNRWPACTHRPSTEAMLSG